MVIVHRIGIASSSETQKELAALGIVVPAEGFVAFDATETMDTWPRIAEFVQRRHASDVVMTTFSKEEIESAQWLALEPEWHYGYPQPNEEEFGFRAATYDLTDWCESCGIGMRQRAPFQMKAEPKWGRNGILQLNWVFDEFFVKPYVWESVFRPLGVEARVVTDRKGNTLETVLQLDIKDEVRVVTSGLKEDGCSKCGRVRYAPVSRGRFPPLAESPKTSAFKTREYFGSGASSYRRVVVSQKIASLMTGGKVRGASFRPVSEGVGEAL